MRVGESTARKVRSDKKKEVKANLPIDLKDSIFRLSYITRTPIKDVCEYICISVMYDEKYLDKLSEYFQRNFYNGTNIKYGRLDNERIKKRIEGEKSTVTIKFKRVDYEFIYKLGFALDLTASRVVAVLLEIGMSDVNIVNQYIKDYLKKELSDNQMNALKELLKYVNKNDAAHSSWASLLAYIVEEVGSPMLKLKDYIVEFLKKV